MSDRLVSAAQPGSAEGVQYHISAKRGQVGNYVFLPGDPDRVPKIASYWDSAHEVSSHREYRIWSGMVGGTMVSACSTGIGCPAAAIAVEELGRIGANTFIRVGSCGSLVPELDCGDLAISTAAVRLDGTSKQYVGAEYPAAASPIPENKSELKKQTGISVNSDQGGKSPLITPINATTSAARVDLLASQISSPQRTSERVIGVIAIDWKIRW